MSKRWEYALDGLTANGWATIEGVEFAELLELCEGLGRQRKMKRLLARREPESDRPSLTASYGLGRFPPHTDGAGAKRDRLIPGLNRLHT
jgi:hypothetical protein